jgi:hypothetical protein
VALVGVTAIAVTKASRNFKPVARRNYIKTLRLSRVFHIIGHEKCHNEASSLAVSGPSPGQLRQGRRAQSIRSSSPDALVIARTHSTVRRLSFGPRMTLQMLYCSRTEMSL